MFSEMAPPIAQSVAMASLCGRQKETQPPIHKTTPSTDALFGSLSLSRPYQWATLSFSISSRVGA